MSKCDSGCEAGLKPNIIDQEVFDREIALCKKLTKENGGKCGWGKCIDCGVIPLMFKLHKGELLEDAQAKKVKNEILK